ncbi:unnamed protein product [Taenia asiatica]|uniref:Uncharacterized protein n=1 Tax=Taenia asiatica TaxID=60517 RepID=A0A0R3VXS4_TAEAS|nr:unnamed protein product [Taenia asiatica]
MDEVDQVDDDEEDRFKISRREERAEPIPPNNTFEMVVEVQRNRFSEESMKKFYLAIALAGIVFVPEAIVRN